MKKNYFFFVLVFCFSYIIKSQDLSQQLISIHTVADINAMNAISNPEQRSLVYVESQQLSYQYINSIWQPFKDSDTLVNYIDSIITIATEASLDVCCPEDPSELRPAVGDVFGCGIIFYIHTSMEWCLIAAFDEFTGPFGCEGITVNTTNEGNSFSEIFFGPQNTQAIVNNCSDPNSAAAVCDNYCSGGCDDWFLPSFSEARLLSRAYDAFFDSVLLSLGLAVSIPDNNHRRLTSHDWSGYSPNLVQTVNDITVANTQLINKTESIAYRPVRIHYF
jgi:hypothetical protein